MEKQRMKKLSNNSQKIVKRDSHGRLLPGSVINPLGKQTGTKDKAKAIKRAFFDAFERIGGLKELIRWINEDQRNKREFYKMVLSLLPKEMAINNESDKEMVQMPAITIIREEKGKIERKEAEFNIGEKVS